MPALSPGYTEAAPTMPSRRRPRRALLTIVVLALWGLITHGTFAGSGDEPHYLAIAHSIAFDGDLDVGNNYGAAEPLIAGGRLQAGAHVQPGPDGTLRPVHDVGLPLLASPYVRLAAPLASWLSRAIRPAAMQRARLNTGLLYRHLLSMAAIVLAAVLAGLMFDSLIAIGAPTSFAFATVLLLALSPPLMIFSILFFTELLSALLCFVVFRRVTLLETSGVGPWGLLGLTTGAMFLVHARNIGLVVPLAALALYQLRSRPRRREALAFAACVAVAIAARTWINYTFWGTLVQGPHARIAWLGVGDVLQQMGMRMTALLVDQEFGLLPYAPIYALGIGGAFVLAREKPALGTGDGHRLRLVHRADRLPDHERARLDGRMDAGGAIPDADRAAAQLVRLCRAQDLSAAAGRAHRRAPDRHQRVLLAAPEDPVERRQRYRRVLRNDGLPRLRVAAVVSGSLIALLPAHRVVEAHGDLRVRTRCDRHRFARFHVAADWRAGRRRAGAAVVHRFLVVDERHVDRAGRDGLERDRAAVLDQGLHRQRLARSRRRRHIEQEDEDRVLLVHRPLPLVRGGDDHIARAAHRDDCRRRDGGQASHREAHCQNLAH